MDPIQFDENHSLRMPLSLMEIKDDEAVVVATSEAD
jgi:hypothetical protein